jgi:hypothetical protein
MSSSSNVNFPFFTAEGGGEVNGCRRGADAHEAAVTDNATLLLSAILSVGKAGTVGAELSSVQSLSLTEDVNVASRLRARRINDGRR